MRKKYNEEDVENFPGFDSANSSMTPYINTNQNIIELIELISKERKIINDMASFIDGFKKAGTIEERKMILSEIVSLKEPLYNTGNNVMNLLDRTYLVKPMFTKGIREELAEEEPEEEERIKELNQDKSSEGRVKITKLEIETVGRLKKREERIIHKKIKKPSSYLKTASRLFSDFSVSLLKKGMFRTIKRDLIKANLQFIPANYISMILFTTLLSAIVSAVIVIFFLFFSFTSTAPFITLTTEGALSKLPQGLLIFFLIPLATYFIIYFYPSLEKSSIEKRINQELPFATIHMSAISGSMVNPTKIFSIISSTKEYPFLEKEFIKLLNEINIYGYDLITALRRLAFYCPSQKLAEIYNGLATTINSGGSFSEFFNKKAETLLFEYRLEREKSAKAAETFMDIYISLVIAAPMVFMLLLMMMKISGLGISLSTQMITLTMVLGVTMLNVIFLTFLHLKQSNA